jgi:hypothetical protein
MRTIKTYSKGAPFYNALVKHRQRFLVESLLQGSHKGRFKPPLFVLEVAGLSRVIHHIVEFPLVAGDGIGIGSICAPRRSRWRCACDPAIMENAAIPQHLKLLGRTHGRSVRTIERIKHADAFYGLLVDAIHE